METVIYNGKRGPEFVSLIRSILIKAKLRSNYLDLLLDDESIKLYEQAFTSDTANETENYEVFEQLGDVLIGSFIVWYSYRRFPRLMKPEGVKIVARLRINYGGEESLAEIADSLGFGPYITSAVDQRGQEDRLDDENYMKLLEDVFEAFIGATAYIIDNKIRQGIGYAIVYDILSAIFDEIPISLKYSSLFDSVTRLKELYDFNKELGTKVLYQEQYLPEKKLTEVLVYQFDKGKKIFIGKGMARRKARAKRVAAEQAIEFLTAKGYKREVPAIYDQ